MKYIFLDESGELGFDNRSSKYFIMTLMACDEGGLIPIRRIVKRVREKLIKKKVKRMPELKGNNSSDKIRKEILERLIKEKIEIFTIILDKSKVYDYLKKKKNKLYNYLSNMIINECSFDVKSVCLVVDRSKATRSLRADFDTYLRSKLKEKLDSCNLVIAHENSKNENCLQVLDFVSWSIFRKYEYQDEEFYNIIKDKIIIKKEVFSKEIEKSRMDPRG